MSKSPFGIGRGKVGPRQVEALNYLSSVESARFKDIAAHLPHCSEGQLYVLINRLKARGFITATQHKSGKRGRPTHLYHITKTGKEVLWPSTK